MRRRVYLYIIKCHYILVLRHVDFPNLGLQIPGGTVEKNETPADAAAREALEETGLEQLGTPEFLGVTVLESQRSDENLLEAWFYRLTASGKLPDIWLHTEVHASGSDKKVNDKKVNDKKVLFELSWMPISVAKECLSNSDCLLLDAAICQAARE